MEKEFEKLDQLYSAIEMLDKLGIPIPPELKSQKLKVEDQIINEDLIPYLRAQFEPVLKKFDHPLVFVIDYTPDDGVRVKLTEKKNFKSIQTKVHHLPKKKRQSNRSQSHRLTPYNAPSPSASEYAKQIPELLLFADNWNLTWKDICEYLKIDVAGDSARRKLKRWVMDNKPDWPKVPEP
jgi:hypothetical protein